MKPLQIALLVVAGAACGAVVMRVARVPGIPQPAPSVHAPVLPAASKTPPASTASPASQSLQAQAAAPQTPLPRAEESVPPPPVAAEPAPPAQAERRMEPAAVPDAVAPDHPANRQHSMKAAAGRPSPFPERQTVPPPSHRARPNPVIVARSTPPLRPQPEPAVPAHPSAEAIPQSFPAQSTQPQPPVTPSEPAAAAPSPAQPEPPPPALSPARTEPENATPTLPQAAPPPEPNKVTLNAGLLIPVRLVDGLSSERNQAGDAFQATLVNELVADGFVIAERGARVEGRVVAADRGGKASGVASLAIVITRIHTSDGQVVPIQTDPFHRHAERSHLQDAATIGGAAAMGAIVGGMAAGGKGAAAGAGVGGGVGAGAVLLTRGSPAALNPESRISFRLAAPVTVTERR